jgi:hypothetical protein
MCSKSYFGSGNFAYAFLYILTMILWYLYAIVTGNIGTDAPEKIDSTDKRDFGQKNECNYFFTKYFLSVTLAI